MARRALRPIALTVSKSATGAADQMNKSIVVRPRPINRQSSQMTARRLLFQDLLGGSLAACTNGRGRPKRRSEWLMETVTFIASPLRDHVTKRFREQEGSMHRTFVLGLAVFLVLAASAIISQAQLSSDAEAAKAANAGFY